MRTPIAMVLSLLVFTGSHLWAAGPQDCRSQLERELEGHGGPYRGQAAQQLFEGTGIRLNLGVFEEKGDVEGAEAFIDKLLRIFARHPELGGQRYFLTIEAAAKDVNCDQYGVVALKASANEERMERHLLGQVKGGYFDIFNEVKQELEALSERFKEDYGVELYFSNRSTRDDVTKATREVARLRSLVTRYPDLAAMKGTIGKLKIGMFYGGLSAEGDLWIKGNAFEWFILRTLRAAIREGRARAEVAEAEARLRAMLLAALEHECQQFKSNFGIPLEFEPKSTLGPGLQTQLAVVRQLASLFLQHPELTEMGFKGIHLSTTFSVSEYGILWIAPESDVEGMEHQIRKQAALLREAQENRAWFAQARQTLGERIPIKVFCLPNGLNMPAATLKTMLNTAVAVIDGDVELRSKLLRGDFAIYFDTGKSHLSGIKDLIIDVRMNPADLHGVLRELAFQRPEAAGASSEGSVDPTVAAKAHIQALREHFVSGVTRPVKSAVK